MGNLRISLILGVLCASLLPAQAQVGTPRYRFRNRAEVEAAARKNKLNLRESYNIIMCAERQGMINSVVRVYEQEVINPFDTPPQLASSLALAHDLLTASVRWDFLPDKSPNPSRFHPVDITLYRDKALEKLPNSPEVLLGYAIWAKEQRQRPKALNLVKRALRYAPNWADLNWWHAQMLGARLSIFTPAQKEQQRERFGLLELRALDKAEALDPYFKRENLSSRSYAYNNARRYQEALDVYDAYVRLRPEYRRYLGEENYQSGRRQQIALIQANRKSN